MNCYLISFGSIKELERIRKRLQRRDITYTLNRENLFILYYSETQTELRDRNFEVDSVQTEIKLHQEHPFYSAFKPLNELNGKNQETSVSSTKKDVPQEVNIYLGGVKLNKLINKRVKRAFLIYKKIRNIIKE